MRRGTIPAAVLVVAASGIALAALGQAQTTRPLSDSLSWLAPFADKVTEVYPDPEAVVAGMVMLAAGAALFAWASFGWRGQERDGADLSRVGPAFSLRLPADGPALVAFAVGTALVGVVIFRLYQRQYDHWLAVALLLALILLAELFAARDLRTLSRLRLRWQWRYLAEGGFVAMMVAMFLAINLLDLTNWRFSAEGDEYAFYEMARRIAGGDEVNFFSQEGVYSAHPVLSSAYQAIFIKLSAGDLFAWKLSMVVLMAVTLIPFYLLVRELFSWRAAVFATAFMAASHYLTAYAHTGFNSLDPIFPTVLALSLLVLGLRRDSSLALYGSGVAAGLGFYTYFSARATIIMIALFLLSLRGRALRLEKLLPIGLAFAVTVAPLFTLHGWGVIDAMFGHGAAEHPESSGVERFAHNIVPSLMAFNYNSAAARYTSGSLLDPVSAVLFALGLGLAVAHVRQPAFRLLLIWWAVAVGITGFAYPRVEVAVPRLHYVVPAAAALAAVALDRALVPILDPVRRPAVRAAVPLVVMGLLMVPVLYLNLHRFWVETPRVDGTTLESVVVQAVMSDECRSQPQPTAVVTPYPEGLLLTIFTAYQMGDRMPGVFSYEAALSSGGALSDGRWEGCIVVDARPEQPLFDELLLTIAAAYPEKQRYELTDGSGDTRVPVFR